MFKTKLHIYVYLSLFYWSHARRWWNNQPSSVALYPSPSPNSLQPRMFKSARTLVISGGGVKGLACVLFLKHKFASQDSDFFSEYDILQELVQVQSSQQLSAQEKDSVPYRCRNTWLDENIFQATDFTIHQLPIHLRQFTIFIWEPWKHLVLAKWMGSLVSNAWWIGWSVWITFTNDAEAPWESTYHRFHLKGFTLWHKIRKSHRVFIW